MFVPFRCVIFTALDGGAVLVVLKSRTCFVWVRSGSLVLCRRKAFLFLYVQHTIPLVLVRRVFCTYYVKRSRKSKRLYCKWVRRFAWCSQKAVCVCFAHREILIGAYWAMFKKWKACDWQQSDLSAGMVAAVFLVWLAQKIGFRFPTKIQLEYGSQWFEIKGSSNIINLVRSFLYIFTFSFTIFFKQKGTAGREHQGIIRIEDWTRDCGLPAQVT